VTLILWAGVLLVILLGVLVFIAARTAASLKLTEGFLMAELENLQAQVALNTALIAAAIPLLGGVPAAAVQVETDKLAANNAALQAAGVTAGP